MDGIFFDAGRKRLVFVTGEANQSFWDDRWKAADIERRVRRADQFVLRETKRLLPKGSRVLDAGCGMASTVFGLHQAGYDAHGLDYAPETVATVRRVAPELQIELGDVREMPYPDAWFDGVWSLGVIEHFYDGYDPIITEAKRVLKPGGLLLLTAPSLSPLRRLMARARRYPAFTGGGAAPHGFYQFALDPADTVAQMKRHGFQLISSRGRGGWLGVQEAMPPKLRRPMQAVSASRNPVVMTARRVLDMCLLNPLCFHSRFFVFRRTD